MTSDSLVEIIEPEKAQALEWVELKVHLSQLRPFERNPRAITEDQYGKLKQSIQTTGYRTRIEATQDFRVIGGHQRLRALRELGYDYVPVLVPTRPLTDTEFVHAMISGNHSNGLWDMDMLANEYDLAVLHDIGLHELLDVRPDEASQTGKKLVKCPQCMEIFPVKGNGHKEEM